MIEPTSIKNLIYVDISIKRALGFLLMLLPFSVVADSHTDTDLTPRIQADLYFLQTEAYFEAKNYEAASETLAKIVALNEQYSLPDEFHYKYASVLFIVGDYGEAVLSLERYLKITEQFGKHYEDALRLLHNVMVAQDESARDDAAHRTARDKGTPAALREYLSKYPDGMHADEVRRSLEEMEAMAAAERDEQAYNDAIEKGTAKALREYLSKYPDGMHTDEVRRSLEEMEAMAAAERDEQAYNDAIEKGTAKALCEYLENYSEGVHAAEANILAEYLRPGRTFRDCENCPEMVVVDAGSYIMGSPENENGHSENETPLHMVTIERPLAVGMYEVKLAEFRAFADEGGPPRKKCWTYVNDEWKERGEHGWDNPGYEQTKEYPVVCVNWNDAQVYVDWLSEKTGEEYRLLSEAEWEYIARAGTTTPFHYGETILKSQANYGGEYTLPVGKYKKNDFGLYDVHGNVWEWVQDCWNESYVDAPSDGTEWERGDCSLRLLRGGAWNVESEFIRSGIRGRNDVKFRGSFNGFRVAKTLKDIARVEPGEVNDVLNVEPTGQTCTDQ